MTDGSRLVTFIFADNPIGKLPDHLLIEIFIRIPISEWVQLSCVKKQWANLFREECLWNAALLRNFPFAGHAKRWPGPIPRGLSKRQISNECPLSPLPSSYLLFTCHSFANVGSLKLCMKQFYLITVTLTSFFLLLVNGFLKY